MPNFLTRLFGTPEPYNVTSGRVSIGGHESDDTMQTLKRFGRGDSATEAQALGTSYVTHDPLDPAWNRVDLRFSGRVAVDQAAAEMIARALDQALTALDDGAAPRVTAPKHSRADYPLAVLEDAMDKDASGGATADGRAVLRIPWATLSDEAASIVTHEASHAVAGWRRLKEDPTHAKDGGALPARRAQSVLMGVPR